jgi:hypothetical protein
MNCLNEAEMAMPFLFARKGGSQLLPVLFETLADSALTDFDDHGLHCSEFSADHKSERGL